MNNIATKLQKYWTHKIAFNNICKFYLSKIFGFMISSVAPTLSSTFYTYLIT